MTGCEIIPGWAKALHPSSDGQSRRRHKEKKGVVLCESLRLGPALRDEIVYSFTTSHRGMFEEPESEV
jgi:hypothetical protein